MKMKLAATIGLLALVASSGVGADDWRPADSVPVRFLGDGRDAVAVYQYKLKFFHLPEGLTLKMNDATNNFAIFRGNAVVPVESLTPAKVWTFKHPFSVMPTAKREPRTTPVLICRQGLFNTYTPQTEEETKIVNERTHSNYGSIVWTNEAGQIDQFCAIVAIDGTVIYRFPVVQKKPKPLVEAIDMSDNGKHAAIAIGETIEFEGEDDDHTQVIGKFSEVWVWDAPDKLTKKSVPMTNDIVELRRMFLKGEL